MGKEKGSQGLVFNVVLPNNFRIYCDFPHIPSLQPHQPAPAISTNLIPVNYTKGSKTDLTTFCKIYAVANSIKQCLQENAITRTHAFAHISSAGLQAMGFKLGEVIDLKEVVKEWAQAPN